MTKTPSPSPTGQAAPDAAAFLAVLAVLAERVAAGHWIASLRAARSDAAAPPSLDWGRIFAIALALALHLAVLVHLMVPPSAWKPAPRAETGGAMPAPAFPAQGLQIQFVEAQTRRDVGDASTERAAMPPTSAMNAPSTPRAEPASAKRQATVAAPSSEAAAIADLTPRAPDDPVTRAAGPDASEPVIRLFRSDGSILLPQAVLDDLQAVESEDRMFSYMTPGLAGAASAFRRPPAVDYTPTRFDADWKPVRSIGADALVAVSEALTYENRSGSFRCLLVPPVCSWGKVVAPVLLDDPTTLNPEEAAECQRVWAAIVDATNQREWLRLRQRFHAECRKPLAVDREPPAPREPASE